MEIKWEILIIETGGGNWYQVTPHGRVDLEKLISKPNRVLYADQNNTDQITFKNGPDAMKAKYFLLDVLGNEGREPFAVDRSDIYLKRLKEE